MVTNEVDDGFGALGDRSRRAIVLRLAERPQAVGELAAALPLSRPAVSQHLKVLKDAGVDAEDGWPLYLDRYADLLGGSR